MFSMIIPFNVSSVSSASFLALTMSIHDIVGLEDTMFCDDYDH
jgi:hypothetical protein